MDNSKSLQSDSTFLDKPITNEVVLLNDETLIESSFTGEGIQQEADISTEKTNTNLPYNYKDDFDNPKNWSKKKKAVCIMIVLLNSFVPYFASAIHIPAIQDTRIAFNTDLTSMTSTFSLYMLMCGFMPLYWAQLSQIFGRKLIYVITTLLFTISSVLCAVSVNFAMFYVFRVLQAIFGCSSLALGGGSLSDIAESHQRGKFMSYLVFILVFSSPVGTIVGGFIDQYLGFRFIFYILSIYGGATAAITFMFMEETLYTDVKNQPKIASGLKDRLVLIFAFNPLKSLVMMKRWNIFLAVFQVAIPFGCYYFFLASLPPTFSEVYNFTPQQVGLCFIGGGIGSCLGSIIPGDLSDRYCERIAAKNNGVIIIESRLRLTFYVLPLLSMGIFMYGWFLHASLHWIAPIIALAIGSFGIMFITTINATYLIDINPKEGAAAFAVNTFVRSVLSMIFSLSSVKMRITMGDGWTYTFLGLISTIVICVCTPILIKYGPRWRKL